MKSSISSTTTTAASSLVPIMHDERHRPGTLTYDHSDSAHDSIAVMPMPSPLVMDTPSDVEVDDFFASWTYPNTDLTVSNGTAVHNDNDEDDEH